MVSPPASWGPGVPTPGCLHQHRWAITQLLGYKGCWGPRPWLFGATRTEGKAHHNTSGVLGSLPWLFVNEHTAKGRTGHTAGRAATGGVRGKARQVEPQRPATSAAYPPRTEPDDTFTELSISTSETAQELAIVHSQAVGDPLNSIIKVRV